ncbi:hypothetical protein Scep_021634 [Stephania cephalantha]|uniref:J domain-containing protein n=1 Tax=Stephania cephalantha TaxID=152367 RepID=A0AAP0I1M1_9MAGN
MQWHPDKNPTASKKESEAKFKQFLEAYNVFIDPPRRPIYDASSQAYSSISTPQAPSRSYSKNTSWSQSNNRSEDYDGVAGEAGVMEQNKFRTVEEILTVAVKPGWKQVTKITFPSGHVFVIDEKPHGLYKREGNDLVYNQRVSLLDVVMGKTLKLPSLNGRSIITVYVYRHFEIRL